MSHVLLRSVVLLLVIAMMPAAAWAGAGDKVDTLLRDYSSISSDLHKMQLTQADLMKQKAALDAQGSTLSRRQDALNAQPNATYAPATNQQKPLGDNKAKKLKKMSLVADAGALPLETRQSELDLKYSQYDEVANDWNAQEQQTVTALNALYRALNSWADRADDFMGSVPFRKEMEASHAGEACAHRALPDGTLSIEELQDYAAGAERCLRYVAARRKPSAAHGD